MRVFLLLLLLGASPVWALQNQLPDHPSPYLAMHGDDPVAWQDWGVAAVEQARKEDKLLFISSGYFSCHWCHVMQRESYQNPRVAALLNEFFVPVKLDRELNPALDEYLIEFLERTQGRAGWPLNVFLTPEGYPLVGATYVPTDRFTLLLERLAEVWASKRDKTRNTARRALLQIMSKAVQGRVDPLPPQELVDRLIRQALSVGDPMEGGFGEQNKFPMAPQLLALLQVRQQLVNSSSQESLDRLLLVTLDQMADQGLRDQLGGGFFRYTVDPSWQVPHFEKMLYTQAQLAKVFLLAGKVYQRQDYLDVAADTLDFTLREMRGTQGALIASFSAVDGDNVEGGYYLWQPVDLQRILGAEDAMLARQYWGMLQGQTTEVGFLPRSGTSLKELAEQTGVTEDALKQRLAQIRIKLLTERAQRSLPADTKELAGWNGMMISALALAADQLAEPRYQAAAEKLRDAIRSRLWQVDEQTLWRARAGNAQVGSASLEDYAFLAEGMHHLARVSGNQEDVAWRDQLLASAWKRFYSATGWQSHQKALIPGMAKKPAQRDGALPAAAGVVMQLSTAEQGIVEATGMQEAHDMSRLNIQEEPFWYASHLLAVLPDETAKNPE